VRLCDVAGITKWIGKWKKNGWKLAAGGDVVNKDDFEKLDEEIKGINIKWVR
jgi:ribonuclease HI